MIQGSFENNVSNYWWEKSKAQNPGRKTKRTKEPHKQTTSFMNELTRQGSSKSTADKKAKLPSHCRKHFSIWN